MSRHARILFPVILVMIVLSGCDSCEEDKPVFPNTVFFIPPAPLTMNVGDSKTVVASVLPFATSSTQTDIGVTTYSSTDTSVATVDNNGKVTCVGPGTANIIASNVNKGGSSRGSKGVICVSTTPTPPPPTTPTPSGAILIVSPTTINFSHTVGQTSCPENIGPLHLSTARGESVTVIAAISGTSALNLGQSTITLPAFGSADLGVNFNCSTQTNFTANIVLNATSATTSGSVTVPVTSNIK